MQPAEYDRMFAQEDTYWWFVGRRRLILSLIRRHFGDRNDLSVLDIGCGTGAMSSDLSRFASVTSVDMSAIALSYTHKRGLQRLCCANAERLPFASASFDAIVALDLLEHVPDDHGAAHEFARVLRPGGCLFATVPAYRFLWSGHDLALMHKRRYTTREFEKLMDEARLNVVRLSYAMTVLFPAVWLVRLGERRLREPRSSVRPLPGPINAALSAVMSAENCWLQRWNLPFGVSVLCVAQRGDA